MTTIMVSLYCETDGSEMSIPVEYHGDEKPENIEAGQFGQDFINAVFDSISIVPLHIEEED
jgi:hypothetical protein